MLQFIFDHLLRGGFDLRRKFCYGHLRCIPIGCQPDGCYLFYRTLMSTACNLHSRKDLRSTKEPMNMRVRHPNEMLLQNDRIKSKQLLKCTYTDLI